MTNVVDTIESKCESCGTTIKALILEGDPGYVLTSKDGIDALLCPQGSSSPPVSSLTPAERAEIIKTMKSRPKP